MTVRALQPSSTAEPAMVKERHPAPDLTESNVLGSVYVDNITVVGKTAPLAREASSALQGEADRCGLPITWSYPDVTTHLETVGIELDLKNGRLRNKASRVWRFDLATRALLARGKMRGEHMEVWLGHAISLLMLARPGYAALSATYRFAETAWGQRTALPREVKQEMRIVVGLVWLSEVDLAAPYVPHVYASDSADLGYGLMYKKASVDELRTAYRWKEKWSFRQHLRGPRVGLVPPSDVADMGGYGLVGLDAEPRTAGSTESQRGDDIEPRCPASSPYSGAGPATAFGQWMQAKAEDGSPSDCRQRPRPRRVRHAGLRHAEDEDALPQVGPLAPPLPASWFDSEGFRLVASKRWRWAGEHINVKETRAAVMGLRHACRVRRNCGRRLVSIVDSMVCVGCLDKGRSSRSAALNAHCRRAAAYTIGCRVRWRLRYVNTKFNVADEPSRRFERASPIKGYPQHDHKETSTSSPSRSPLESIVKISSLPPGLGLAGHPPAGVERDKDPAQPRESCADPSHRSACPSSTSTPSASSRNAGPPLRLGHAQLLRRAQRGRGFLELFSGEGGLSQAFKDLNLKTFPCMDIKDGPQYDLLDPVVQLVILEGIRRGLFWYVHMGTPCCVWSRARHFIKNHEKARHKERIGVALALFSCRVAYECSRNGVFWSIENPRTSRLWDFDPVRELGDLPDVFRVLFVHCSYGSSHLKPTALLTNFFALSSLASVCSRDHTHVELRGFESVTLPSGVRVSRNRTAGAGAYPRALCTAWARAASMTAPAGARGSPDAPDEGDLEVRLRDAARRPASRVHERLRPARQRLQAEPDLGLVAAADPDALESRYDHLRPFIVFGQDSNLEAARKRAARAQRGPKGRWPALPRL